MPPQLSNLPASQRAKLILLEFLRMGLFAVLAIVLVRYFLFKPFYVRGASMEPNYFEHEYLIIDEITYRIREPERGEVVVFRYPGARREFFLKRIVGLPGETVKVKEGRITMFNAAHPEGFTLEEEYLPKHLETAGDLTVVLEDREYFLLGDNRASSWDSRGFGPIARQQLVGRAVFRGWPFERAGVLVE